ncbi:MAG TPA: hypothetical protein VD928_00800 [Candidatus Paceibacterota bacterium]|nr:hypothetical protein [Candidatus Paceibacterota bacterium]
MNSCSQNAEALIGCVVDVIINPIIALIFAAGLVVFIWGLVEFMWGLSTDAEGKNDGKRHMLWGIIGMFIMFAAFGILRLIANTIGPEATQFLP